MYHIQPQSYYTTFYQQNNTQEPPVEIVCFICNSRYFTTVCTYQDTSPQSKILSLCQSFCLSDEAENAELLTLAQYNDPFCVNCSQKLLQIQELGIQLERIKAGIENLKTEISKSVASSFPQWMAMGETRAYQLKSKIVKHTFSDFSFEITNARERHWEDVSNNGDDDYAPSDQSDSSSIAQPVKQRLQNKRQPVPKYKKAKSAADGQRQQQEPRRLPETIPADPSGQCHLCPSKFPSQFALSRHIKRLHSGIVYNCQYCEKTFTDSSNRKSHERTTHLPPENVVCELCGKVLKGKANLREHVQAIHEGKKKVQYRKKIPSQCTECGAVLSTPKILKEHILRLHTENSETKPCPICSRPFKMPGAIRRHLKSHIGPWEKKLKEGKTFHWLCHICPLDDQIGYTSREKVRRHYKESHPGERLPYKTKGPNRYIQPRPPKRFFCEACPDHPGFLQRSCLSAHIKSGHKSNYRLDRPMPVPCKICGRPFLSSDQAKEHENTHLPQGYHCSICDTFELLHSDIKLHYDSAHPGVKIPTPQTLDSRNGIVPRPFTCPKCPNHPGFSTKRKCTNHKRRVHNIRCRRPRKPVNSDPSPPHQELPKKKRLNPHIAKRRSGTVLIEKTKLSTKAGVLRLCKRPLRTLSLKKQDDLDFHPEIEDKCEGSNIRRSFRADPTSGSNATGSGDDRVRQCFIHLKRVEDVGTEELGSV